MSNRRVAPDNALTLVDVCLRLRKRLDWYGLPRLKPEAVLEADQDTIVALITGERRLQPVRLAFDRHTGHVRRSVVPHDIA
jgi:hypothetical protein